MANCYVVVEGEMDAAILSRVFADQVNTGEVEVKIGRGRSSAVSLARTMLVLRPESLTALVLDADSTDQERTGEMEAELEGSLADVSRRERFGVFLLVPTIEACLFRDLDGLNGYFGSELSAEQLVQSRYDPKSVLKSKLGERGEDYDGRTLHAILDALDSRRFREAAGIQDLLSFVNKTVTATP